MYTGMFQRFLRSASILIGIQLGLPCMQGHSTDHGAALLHQNSHHQYQIRINSCTAYENFILCVQTINKYIVCIYMLNIKYTNSATDTALENIKQLYCFQMLWLILELIAVYSFCCKIAYSSIVWCPHNVVVYDKDSVACACSLYHNC